MLSYNILYHAREKITQKNETIFLSNNIIKQNRHHIKEISFNKLEPPAICRV